MRYLIIIIIIIQVIILIQSATYAASSASAASARRCSLVLYGALPSSNCLKVLDRTIVRAFLERFALSFLRHVAGARVGARVGADALRDRFLLAVKGNCKVTKYISICGQNCSFNKKVVNLSLCSSIVFEMLERRETF